MPIYFAFADNHLYSLTVPGQKADWMRENPRVRGQVHEWGNTREWRSVVVNGHYEELPDTALWRRERGQAWSLLSQRRGNWWEPGSLKPTPPNLAPKSSHLFFRIRVESITGRAAVEETAADPKASGRQVGVESWLSRSREWLSKIRR